MIPKNIKIPFIFLLPLIITIVSCAGETNSKSSHAIVKTSSIKKHSPLLKKNYPARIRASTDAKLSFRVAGPIDKVLVNEGDFVQKGELLAQIDRRDYKTQLRATEAKYKEVKSEAQRIIALYEKDKVSDNEYDKAVAGIEQAEAKYEAHKNELEDTRLTAPFTGYVTDIIFDSHETVDAGMPVIAMIDTQRYEIVTHLPAGDYLNRHQIENISCKTVEDPDTIWPLEMKNMVPQANLNGLYTACFNLRNSGKERILPGMSAEVIIEYKKEQDHFYRVPSSALFEKDNQSNLWIVDTTQNTIHAQPVEIIRVHNSGEAIIDGDLSDDIPVVSRGVHSLKEGQEVKEMNKPSESNVGDLL
ncbi:MAG: efflux RND transporter periplasmic adaptor subunit [Marinilabilia sp.]